MTSPAAATTVYPHTGYHSVTPDWLCAQVVNWQPWRLVGTYVPTYAGVTPDPQRRLRRRKLVSARQRYDITTPKPLCESHVTVITTVYLLLAYATGTSLTPLPHKNQR